MSVAFLSVDKVNAIDITMGERYHSNRTRFRRDFVNNSPYSIGIVTRDGLVYELPANHEVRTNNINVIDGYSLTKSEILAQIEILKEMPGTSQRHTLLTAFNRAVSQATLRDHDKLITIRISYYIRYKEIGRDDLLCYSPTLDIVIYDTKLHKHPKHPFGCTLDDEALLLPSVATTAKGGLNFSVAIIDNSIHQRMTNKYINIGGEIYPITVTRDSELENGVHLTTTRPVTKLDEDGMGYMHWPYEEGVRRLNLHNTVELATTNGDAREIVKKRIELEMAKADIVKLELERKLEIKRMATEAIKAVQLQYSNTYKGLKDLLTLGGALIGAIGTLMLTLSRLKA